MSGPDGIFELQNIPENEYLLQIRYMGYKPKLISVRVTSNDTKLGKISLTAQAVNLDAVGITAEREMLTNNLIKETFEVGKNIANSGASIVDAMKTLPGLTVDMERESPSVVVTR